MKKVSHKPNTKSIKFAIVMLVVLLTAGSAWAELAPEKVHFLIPGGAGGGWDGTARGVGKALVDSGILKHASFENMSGGGGGKALNHLISTARRQQGTLMVNSTPIIIRSLQGVFPAVLSGHHPHCGGHRGLCRLRCTREIQIQELERSHR